MAVKQATTQQFPGIEYPSVKANPLETFAQIFSSGLQGQANIQNQRESQLMAAFPALVSAGLVSPASEKDKGALQYGGAKWKVTQPAKATGLSLKDQKTQLEIDKLGRQAEQVAKVVELFKDNPDLIKSVKITPSGATYGTSSSNDLFSMLMGMDRKNDLQKTGQKISPFQQLSKKRYKKGEIVNFKGKRYRVSQSGVDPDLELIE